MSRAIAALEEELRRLKKIEARAGVQCAQCDGQGFYFDTTYDRTGEDRRCEKCFGTGLPAARVNKIIDDAFAPYRRASKGGE